MKRSHLIALAVLVVLCAATPWASFLQSVEADSIDLRFRLRGPRKVASKVVVVAVDDTTEREWVSVPKSFWAGAISRLVAKARDAGAKQIGVDFVFSVDADAFLHSVGSRQTPNTDLDLVVSQSPDKIALGTRDGDDIVLPLGDPTDGRRFLSLNGLQSDLKVVRELPRWDDSLDPPLMGMAAGLALGEAEIGSPVAINYSGGGIPIVSGVELLAGSVDIGVLKDAIVLVGETYHHSQDRFDTPFAQSTPGVLIQAEAVATLLDGRELRAPSKAFEAPLLGLLALFTGTVALRMHALRFLLAAVASALAWGATAHAAFGNDVVLPVVAPLVTLAIVPLVIFPIRATEERFERLWLRSQLGQMVSDEFAKRLESQRDAKLGTLGTFNAALMFLDVVGFSKRSNEQSPERLVQELNEVFGLVVEHVQDHGGTVLNFIGDGLFAMFDDDGMGADRSLSAAKAILTDQRAGGFPLRIGLALGEVSLALIGSSERKQMTVYGSAVNLASRLEQAGKELGSSLVASQHFAGSPGLRSATIEVKGWDEPISVYFMPS